MTWRKPLLETGAKRTADARQLNRLYRTGHVSFEETSPTGYVRQSEEEAWRQE
jgi:hypothetical protein